MDVFGYLKVLNSRTMLAEAPVRREMSPDLKRMITSMPDLTDLELSFGRPGKEHSGNTFKFAEIFGNLFPVRNLRSLTLSGIIVSQEDLRKLTTKHRSIREMVLGDILVVMGD
ncbi:hypothetical protein MMC08_002407 [Hypocenomyce scalaris]|nr:hypothetical protein [Hypocenomyce scalaris]